MLAAVGFAFVLALHDFAVQHGVFGLQEFYLLHLGIPAFLLVMALILLNRFLKTLELADSMQANLTSRLAEREDELLKSHERLRKLERLNAIADERQRIMENLHDGVGSQLVTSLMLVKGGSAGQTDMINLLQDCIEEMRMALDSLAAESDDLLSLLENFRTRISSRFSAIGLRLEWVDQELPGTAEIPPQVGLQVLRILQEALANVLKHARATKVIVSVGMDGGMLVASVSDDGVGTDAVAVPKGHGIGNMRNRAQRIGGSLDIVSGAGGTTVRLAVALAVPDFQAGAVERLSPRSGSPRPE
jgi:signal transduction histidine kinase